MEINRVWIDQQRAVCNAATEGPWEMTESEGFCDHVGKACPYGKPCEDSGCDDCDDWTWTQGAFLETGKTIYCGDYEGNIDADIRFCVSARTALPAALDEIERLAADNRKLREAHELAQSGYGTYAHTGNENAPSGTESEAEHAE